MSSKIEAEKVIGISEAATGLPPYPTRDDMLKHLRAGMAEMVKAGTMPAGAEVTDVMIVDVTFLVALPDGSVAQVGARICSADEVMAQLGMPEKGKLS